ncbi:2-amino-4-hydroxy-6-hydroxymethyldihydropteridine diphosphokinase [Oerskovia turbata]
MSTAFAGAVHGADGRPLDQIRLTGLRATGHHGVFEHERIDGQLFRADVVLHLDTRPAAAGDDLADTVSYAVVAEDVVAILAGSPVDLVETVAERIAAVVLRHPAVVAADVAVHKPQAPIAVPFDDVEVVIRRDRVKTPVVDAELPRVVPIPVGSITPAVLGNVSLPETAPEVVDDARAAMPPSIPPAAPAPAPDRSPDQGAFASAAEPIVEPLPGPGGVSDQEFVDALDSFYSAPQDALSAPAESFEPSVGEAPETAETPEAAQHVATEAAATAKVEPAPEARTTASDLDAFDAPVAAAPAEPVAPAASLPDDEAPVANPAAAQTVADPASAPVETAHVPVETAHAPVEAAPAAHVPVAAVPTAHVPVAAVPTAHVPVAAVPTAHAPVEAVPLEGVPSSLAPVEPTTGEDAAPAAPEPLVDAPVTPVGVETESPTSALPDPEPSAGPASPFPEAAAAPAVVTPVVAEASDTVDAPVEESAPVAAVAVPETVPAPALDRLDEAPTGFVPVVLALGANLGDAQQTLRDAVTDLDRISGLEITDVSPLARTAAVGGPEQPDYLNAILLARTTLAPRALLHAIQGVENAHGRVRAERNGPRTLDVDLIVFGSVTEFTEDLELPHPRAHERAFVLEPWSQIAPDAVLPGLGGGAVAALAATAPDRGGIRWLALDWLTDAEPEPAPARAEAPLPVEQAAPEATTTPTFPGGPVAPVAQPEPTPDVGGPTAQAPMFEPVAPSPAPVGQPSAPDGQPVAPVGHPVAPVAAQPIAPTHPAPAPVAPERAPVLPERGAEEAGPFVPAFHPVHPQDGQEPPHAQVPPLWADVSQPAPSTEQRGQAAPAQETPTVVPGGAPEAPAAPAFHPVRSAPGSFQPPQSAHSPEAPSAQQPPAEAPPFPVDLRGPSH